MISDDSTTDAAGEDAGSDDAFERLLESLHHDRGLDLTSYKPTTLRRRVLHRMHALRLGHDFDAYNVYLQTHVDEVRPLFDSLLVNVTSFFRDPEAWEYLAREVVPHIVHRHGPGDQIRVWSAGCASGEEPFSIAMLLAEELGIDELARRVKVYATDWDEAALEQARRARYDRELASVPEPLRAKYFQIDGDQAALHNAVRRAVIFGQHDLVEDAPISRVDLLLCRNTLMYFTAETQARILSRMHFALDEQGFLFLGRAEMLLTHSNLFTPTELRHRVFRKNAGTPDRRAPRPVPVAVPRRQEDLVRHVRLRDAALEVSPVAQVVLDPQQRVGVVNQRATQMFRIGSADIGRPLQDLELSYRPIDLRSMVDQARETRTPVTSKNVEHHPAAGELQHLDIEVAPLYRDGELIAITITMSDVSHHHKLQESLQRFSENLETAYEELQSANEELETTNEELQSANEELETTNEELQAANEEMETVNEELRSTNEELQASNEALRDRDEDLRQANTYLNAILASIRVAVIVLGEDLHVRVWNDLAADVWGLRSDEVVGRGLAELDIGLPVAQLLGPIRECLGQPGPPFATQKLKIDARNRRGREFSCLVTMSRLGAAQGMCILMEDVDRGGREPDA